MELKKIFETKKSINNETIYTQMVQTKFNSPQYTDVNYEAIVREGYKRNFVMFRCLQEIIKAAIQLRVTVMQQKSEGDDVEIKNHPAAALIEKPNPMYGQAMLITRAIAFYYLGGEAPFHYIKTPFKNKEQLYVYRPDKIKFSSTGDVDNPYSKITYSSGSEITIDPKSFMLWKNFNPLDEFDGLGHGMSLLEPILKNGDLLNEMINWNMSLMQNGGNLSGVILTEQQLSDDVYDRAQAEIKNKHQGSKNVGKFLLLEGGGSFKETGITPKDADWIEGKKSTVVDICMGMGVDPIVIGYKEFSSYNNAKEAYKALYTSTVIPLMQSLMDEFTNFLELGENEYLEVDYSHIPALQEDVKEVYDRLSKANDMTINEKRQARGLEPIPGGDIIAPDGAYSIIDGKVYIPMNFISVDEEDGEGNPKGNIEEKPGKDQEDKNFIY